MISGSTFAGPWIETVSDWEVEVRVKPCPFDEDGFGIRELELQASVSCRLHYRSQRATWKSTRFPPFRMGQSWVDFQHQPRSCLVYFCGFILVNNILINFAIPILRKLIEWDFSGNMIKNKTVITLYRKTLKSKTNKLNTCDIFIDIVYCSY